MAPATMLATISVGDESPSPVCGRVDPYFAKRDLGARDRPSETHAREHTTTAACVMVLSNDGHCRAHPPIRTYFPHGHRTGEHAYS